MAVKLRLTRVGGHKRPFYRIVAAESRMPRDGRFIEVIGRYDPTREPSLIEIDKDRALYWLSQGAQPSGCVRNLLVADGVIGRENTTPEVQEEPE